MELYGEAWAARFDELANASIAGREGLFRIADACFAGVPSDARILIVGCGTGTELLHLASRHPAWRFEAVEPAAAMLAVCRRRVEAAGLQDRVQFHERDLAGLRVEPCHAATAILVSQHLVEDELATRFFRDLAANLGPNGLLFSADLCAPAHEPDREFLLSTWRKQAATAGVPDSGLVEMRARFGSDLALRSGPRIEGLLLDAGFATPVRVFQSLIYVAWCSRARA